jgi:hypothetical protein
MSTWIIATIRYCVIAIGIFLGFFFYFDGNPASALNIVLITGVGIIGIISFISHVIFHESDARRLGMEDSSPDFQFEVGFANLALGIMAFIAFFLNWGIHAAAAIVICYALYILQAAIFHAWRFAHNKRPYRGYIWLSVVLPVVYAGMICFFAISGLMT